jgi:hypothetical protein
MTKRITYSIEFIGGPLDGDEQLFAKLPAHDYEIVHESHSYCFDFHEGRFTYRGRWRHLDLGRSLLTYRTFGEALRQLGQLQTVGAISAKESLAFQARIKVELRHGQCDR